MFEGFRKRREIIRHKKEYENIHKAGKSMANKVIDQVEKGASSPYEVTTQNNLSMPDEMFLLRATRRATEFMAKHLPHHETLSFDEQQTTLVNHKNPKTKELAVIFVHQSEA